MTALLLDEMYPPSLGTRLRKRGHDVVAVLDIEVGLSSRSDPEVLAWAARHGRCVVTENIRDFARLASSTPHAGILMAHRGRFPRNGNGMRRLEDALDLALTQGRVPVPGAVLWLSSG